MGKHILCLIINSLFCSTLVFLNTFTNFALAVGLYK